MWKETPDEKEKAEMDEKMPGQAETTVRAMTDAFWSVYGKIMLDVESTLKSKHGLRFPFADSYLIVKNSGRVVKRKAKGFNARKHCSSPKDISQHTEILL